MILTDEQGRPFERPRREDYKDAADYLRAVYAYYDKITNAANAAFADAFQGEMKRCRRKRNNR